MRKHAILMNFSTSWTLKKFSMGQNITYWVSKRCAKIRPLLTPVKCAIGRAIYRLSNAHSIMWKDIMVAELGWLEADCFSSTKCTLGRLYEDLFYAWILKEKASKMKNLFFFNFFCKIILHRFQNTLVCPGCVFDHFWILSETIRGHSVKRLFWQPYGYNHG